MSWVITELLSPFFLKLLTVSSPATLFKFLFLVPLLPTVASLPPPRHHHSRPRSSESRTSAMPFRCSQCSCITIGWPRVRLLPGRQQCTSVQSTATIQSGWRNLRGRTISSAARHLQIASSKHGLFGKQIGKRFLLCR